jgi:uncharacterized pyridoxamine 5'-phosphate oxidase family protein
MKTATISELKQELTQIPHSRIQDLCLRLARFKKENKELLTYLLFEAHDTEAYIVQVKEEMDIAFAEINTSHVYFAKKTLRKILRMADKYIRYCGMDSVEAELRIYFCRRMKEQELPINKTPVLSNMYQNQLKKIEKTVAALHEDLQYDFRKAMDLLH